MRSPRRWLPVLLVALLFVSVTPVLAQTPGGGSALINLPLDGRTLMVGAERRGELTPADPLWTDGTHVQAWGLALRRGQTVWVDLISDAFDAYLWVAGPGLGQGLNDDDGAGACHARVTWTAGADGVFHVVANTVAAGATGAYLLRVTETEPPRLAGDCGENAPLETIVDSTLWQLPLDGRRLAVGATVSGELGPGAATGGDGAYLEAWGLDLRADETVTVDLVSEAFDAFLWIAGPGLAGALSDDDGAGGCNARITFTAPAGGMYRVVASTLSAGEEGAYRLVVTREPGPTSGASCDV